MTRPTGSGNIQSPDALLDLISWHVFVAVWQIGHLLELDDFDLKLISVLLNQVLRVVWTVDILAMSVLSWTSVVTTDDEVGSTVVLADNGVPESLARTTHAHSQREKTENGHAVRVARKKSLVDTDTSEVVNVTWLGETNDWVDEDVGLAVASSANSKLTVSAMHWVSGLESDNLGPAKLVKVLTDLSWGVAQSNVVVVHQTVDGVELTTDVDLAGGVEEVLHSWVIRVTTEGILGLLLPSFVSAIALMKFRLPTHLSGV